MSELTLGIEHEIFLSSAVNSYACLELVITDSDKNEAVGWLTKQDAEKLINHPRHLT